MYAMSWLGNGMVCTVQVLRVSDGEDLALTTLWGENEKAVVVFARSFGCPFCQCVFDGQNA
jgi:hypothetical protein